MRRPSSASASRLGTRASAARAITSTSAALDRGTPARNLGRREHLDDVGELVADGAGGAAAVRERLIGDLAGAERAAAVREHLEGVLVGDDGGHVEEDVADRDDAAAGDEGRARECAGVVGDEVEPSEAVDKAGDDALGGVDEGSRPEQISSRHLRFEPHGGRQLSSVCDGRCYGVA